jgi:hypothetical protein
VLVGFQEGVLEYVLGVLLILCDAFGQPKDLSFVTFNEFRKRRAVAPLGARHQR